MFGNRLVNTNAGGGGCTNTVDLYNPFPDGGGVALYQLNGNAEDLSPNNYDGVASNVTYGTGVFGQAGVFNGSTSKIDLPLTTLGSSSFSISMWLKFDSVGSGSTQQYIFTKYKGSASGTYGMLCQKAANQDTINFTAYNTSNGTYGTVNTTTAMTAGVWYNYVLVFNSGSAITAYLNSSSEATTGTSGTFAQNPAEVTVGAYYSGPTYLEGSIDQVRIFNRALRPYEVEALYTEEYCTPTIVPSEHFNTVLYTGNNAGSRTISGVGFNPDLVWIKPRTAAESHALFDVQRPAGQRLVTNSTGGAQQLSPAYAELTTDGFIVGGVSYNDSATGDYVAWNFKAGGAAVENTDGTITSQVSANTEAGFSIVKWTGDTNSSATVGHGLNKAPSIYFLKGLQNSTDSWIVSGSSDIFTSPTTNFLRLNTTDGVGSTTVNAVGSNETTINIGVRNYSAESSIAYCFAEVEGFSSFGSYVGTGSSSGNTVVTGFEPAFVMVKRTDASGGSWLMVDNKRVAAGNEKHELFADTASAESGIGYDVAFLENGFQMQTTTSNANASGASYIYMAFAADPTTVEPTLEDSFNTVLYSGQNTDKQVTNVGFQPDLVWVKNRDDARNNVLSNSVSGATNFLISNSTGAEITTDPQVLSLDIDGFTVKGNTASVNRSGFDYVAWNWKGAELPAINSNGSITSVVSANPAAGFSIVSWQGIGVTQSIGHGLNAVPSMIIQKRRTAGDWEVYTSTTGASQKLILNSTASAASSTAFGNTTPTSNVYYAGAYADPMIAYCFAEVAGFSKFGSYSGTDASGNYVATGFEPAFVLIKRSIGGAGNWILKDNKRNPTNPVTNNLYANLSNEANDVTTLSIDFNPLGFTVNGTSGDVNDAGTNNYIYMAFANQF